MIPMCVHTCSISASRCDETSTVVPLVGELAHQVRTSRVPCGSRPLVGSSSTSSSRGRSSAAASPSRCFMPSEYCRYGLRGRGAEPDALERLVGALPGGARVGGRVAGVEPREVGAAGQVRVERRSLDERADARQHVGAAPRASRRPAGTARPLVGRTSPSSMRIVVVLPEPFGPMNP